MRHIAELPVRAKKAHKGAQRLRKPHCGCTVERGADVPARTHRRRSVSVCKPSETWRVIAARFAESGCTGRLLEVTKQLRQGNPEADRQHFEDAETGLPAPILQLGDVDAAYP